MAKKTQINNNGGQINSLTEEDRLSSLPDNILTNILSRLPINYAVKTAVISRRWRHLWKTITTFELTTFDMRFTIVSKLLRTITSPNIRIFNYTFYGTTRYFYWGVAEHLFFFLSRHNIEVLKLTSRSPEFTPTYLPLCKSVFKFESLVHLELDGVLDDDNDYFPVDDDSINLPNLRILVLRVIADDSDYSRSLLRTLLKCCALIEDLCLRVELCDEEVSDWFVVAPNVKALNIEAMVPASRSSIVIDAPKLEKLKISDPCSYYVFGSVPTMLVEANIKLRKIGGMYWLPDIEDVHKWTLHGHDLAISEFVRGMCSVRYFKVQCIENMHSLFGPRYCGDMAVFPHLTFLKVTIGGLAGWEDLLRSLHCFPNLEHLELKLDDFNMKAKPFRVAPIVLPDCLLTKLKRIIVRKRITQEVELLEFILNHANVLEELHIYDPTDCSFMCGPFDSVVCAPYFFMDLKRTQPSLLWEEYNFCQTLFKFPRSSLNCEIVVSGAYINASSNAFENEVMNCQVSFEKLGDSDSD